MYQLLQIEDAAHLQTLVHDSSVPLVQHQKLQQLQPDAMWVVVENERVVARCALWWKTTPSVQGQHTGTVGCYASRDESSAFLLLTRACQELQSKGCTCAIGPMDGNTWRSYRFVTERGDQPPFFLEPSNATTWPQNFTAAGFTPVAHYSSTLCTDLAREDLRLRTVVSRLETAGVTIRTLQMQNFEDELRRIYEVCTQSFRRNFLYSSVAEEEFIAQYAAVAPFINSDLVLLAEHEGQVVGFSFALPDALQAQRGGDINTVVLKTVAVLPGRAYAGLGNLLTARTHTVARHLGFTRVIHALMHDGNASRVISGFYGQPLRGYTLYSKPL
jgi:predicted N-acetyltransferase YhbS